MYKCMDMYKVHVKIGVGPGLPYRDNEFAIKAMVGHGMDEGEARDAPRFHAEEGPEAGRGPEHLQGLSIFK